jgi:hypothetical protein
LAPPPRHRAAEFAEDRARADPRRPGFEELTPLKRRRGVDDLEQRDHHEMVRTTPSVDGKTLGERAEVRHEPEGKVFQRSKVANDDSSGEEDIGVVGAAIDIVDGVHEW